MKKEEPNFFEWYFINLSKLALVFCSLYLFIKRAWAGEDAFIFFRYVDNLLNGNGLVFNIGERVEGFTSPLWVFFLAFFKFITHAQLRPLAIILGLCLSTLAIALLLAYDKSKYFFPLIVVLLVTNSALRDFATSGFETSLTYLLLVIVLILLKGGAHYTKPLLMGIVLSLLVLNRPEAFLILLYVGGLVLTRAFQNKKFKSLMLFSFPVVVLLGGYEIFRMGYFAALLPNTFYAKKGGSFYIAQGFNYLKDFIMSYPLTSAILAALSIYSLINSTLRKTSKHFLVLAVLLAGYVLYAGGDYMHGRSLLMAFIVWSFAGVDTANFIIDKLALKFKLKPLAYQVSLILFCINFGAISLKQIPITARAGKQVNDIANERARFGYYVDSSKFADYINLPITFELGWAERGLYYRELSQQLGENISVVNPNIGYFAYAAGSLVNDMGGVLVDPYIARQPILARGKIGHENDPQLEYVYSRKPTFAYTPFNYWNENAHYKWNDSHFAYAIQGDSNDSFVPIFDLSNKLFLEKFSALTGHSIKAEIDTAQRKFITDLNKDNLNSFGFDGFNYLGFLKIYWYPYAAAQDQQVFDAKARSLGWQEGNTIYEKFYIQNAAKATELWAHITSPMSFNQFMLNIRYSMSSI